MRIIKSNRQPFFLLFPSVHFPIDPFQFCLLLHLGIRTRKHALHTIQPSSPPIILRITTLNNLDPITSAERQITIGLSGKVVQGRAVRDGGSRCAPLQGRRRWGCLFDATCAREASRTTSRVGRRSGHGCRRRRTGNGRRQVVLLRRCRSVQTR